MPSYDVEFQRRMPKKGQKTMELVAKIKEKVDGEPIELGRIPAIRIYKGDRWSYSVGVLEEGKFEKKGGSVPSSIKPWEESTQLWNKLRPKLKEVGITDSEKLLGKIAAILEPSHFEIKRKKSGVKTFEGAPHPGGGVTDELVYEPIGGGRYAYLTADGKKGIAESRAETEESDGGKETFHYLDFEDRCWLFEEGVEPLTRPLFDPPSSDSVKKWVEGDLESPTVSELWRKSLIYYKSFLDLPRREEYSFLVLMAFQSWLAELLPIMFYLGIQAEFGGGKTVSGEAVILPCRHGIEVGSTSASFISRGIDAQKLTVFADELDASSGAVDSPLYQIFRQGYRREAKYTRSDRENPDELRSYNVFGAKIYTRHSTVETALRTRTVPLHSTETTNVKYPVINVDKLPFGEDLREDYFFWWMDNALELKDENLESILPPQVDQVDQVDQIYGEWGGFRETKSHKVLREGGVSPNNRSTMSTMSTQIGALADRLRDYLYERKITALKKSQIEKLGEVSGRNAELMYQVFALANLLKVDIDENIAAVFKQKRIEEAEEREVGLLGMLRDLLIDEYKEKLGEDDFKTSDGHVKIANKELYDKYNAKLRDEGMHGVSPHTFKKNLTELGFSDGTNRRKLKVTLPDEYEPRSRICNVFDERVVRKLGIDKEKKEGRMLTGDLKDEVQRIHREKKGGNLTWREFVDVLESELPREERKRLEEVVKRLKNIPLKNGGLLFRPGPDEGVEELGGEDADKDVQKEISEDEPIGGHTEFEREIAQKLLWEGAMTVEEIRSKLDIDDLQFNEAFNRLAESGKIVRRDGRWVHRENILGPEGDGGG